jgi:sporulation protein YlmC with PRC-barrel domain
LAALVRLPLVYPAGGEFSRKGGQSSVTDFAIGADVSCSDGPCGTVSRLIVEPGAETVTHLVVDPKHRGRSRLVPVGLADAAAGRIKLRCSKAEFDKLDAAEQTELLHMNTAGDPIPTSSGYMPPSLIGLALYDGERVSTHGTVPAGEVDVRRGEPVYTTDVTDSEIGRIRGLVMDPGSHHVSHILLEEGHLWGRKEVAIPISAVTRIGDIVRLNISRQQVEDLPPVDIDHSAP